MSELKFVIAKNIYNLRVSKGMTQLELAEKLHYSDKAVSKWEKGDSVPEITTLVAISEIFEVNLDYFVKEHKKEDVPVENKKTEKLKNKNRALISTMCIILVWLLATMAYFLIDILMPNSHVEYLPFLYAVPITLIVWLIFNSMWFNQHRNFLIISLLMWVALAVLFFSFIIFKVSVPNLQNIFLLGIPAQLIIWLWSKIKVNRNKH